MQNEVGSFPLNHSQRNDIELCRFSVLNQPNSFAYFTIITIIITIIKLHVITKSSCNITHKISDFVSPVITKKKHSMKRMLKMAKHKNVQN